jgi:lipid-A-disaccharide synthase-like uncharacterized protein
MLPAIFFSSLAALSFEILLLRIFSIALWYHFAFMVVSIAMLGLAASGSFCALFRSWRGRALPLRPWYFIFLGGSMALSYLAILQVPFDPVRISWDRLQILYVSLYYLLLALPFFIAGCILVSAFSLRPDQSGRIYGADLTGAAAGTVIVLLLQSWMSPGQAVMVSSALAICGSVFLGGVRLRILSSAAVAVCLVISLVNPPVIRVVPSPYKPLPLLLGMEGAEILAELDSGYGQVHLFASPGVRHAPGLSLSFRGALPGQAGIAVDGAAVSTVTLADPSASFDYLDYLPSSLAFAMKAGGDVLLLDPRGGHRALLAERYRAARVDCTASNPGVHRLLLTKGMLDGSPCSGPVIPGFGRNILRERAGVYDLIDLDLTGTLPYSAAGGGEDYRLTVEAFTSYLDGLAGEGILSISIYITPPYRSELRLFTTLLGSLSRAGVEDPGGSVLALRSLELLCFLVKKEPFADQEIAAMKDFSSRLWFDPVFYRGLDPASAEINIRSRGGNLARAFSTLADPATAPGFVRDYAFDIAPTTDDRPFFHESLRLSTLRRVYSLVEGKWDFFVIEGYLVQLILVQVVLLGLVFVLLPVLFARRKSRLRASEATYFGFLGAGFMLVEVGAMHYLILPLEHPVTAVCTAIFTLLVSSGAGSYLSRDVPPGKLWKAALAAGLLCLAYAVVGRPAAELLSGLTVPVRVAWVFAVLSPAGLVMGMLFPGGIRHLGLRGQGLIPLAWAVNGFFSVVAPVLAIMIATAAGFRVVFLLGALSYLGASLAGKGFCASPTMGTKRTLSI